VTEFFCLIDYAYIRFIMIIRPTINVYISVLQQHVFDYIVKSTRCFIKDPFLFFFIIYSNDDQFTQNLYQL